MDIWMNMSYSNSFFDDMAWYNKLVEKREEAAEKPTSDMLQYEIDLQILASDMDHFGFHYW